MSESTPQLLVPSCWVENIRYRAKTIQIPFHNKFTAATICVGRCSSGPRVRSSRWANIPLVSPVNRSRAWCSAPEPINCGSVLTIIGGGGIIEVRTGSYVVVLLGTAIPILSVVVPPDVYVTVDVTHSVLHPVWQIEHGP